MDITPLSIQVGEGLTMSESWIQIITIIGSNLLIMLTFFGVTISLHNGIREELRGIQAEMKDFHGRLCAIEERNKNPKEK